MLIRSFDESDRARLTELTIETFRPIFEDVYPALLGEVIFANQWANWRADYHTEIGAALCEHAFAQMRALGAEMVEIRTGADDFHAPARALYESLGCVQYPTAAYYREL
jgi:hypothetical protein